jgi:nucleoid-associated protein YgaU
MLDDFSQDKQDQNLDPLSEESSFQWGKKVGLVCMAVALIGLFIFFTSDSWGSDAKSSNKDELYDEVELLKTRVSALEGQLQNKTASAPVLGSTQVTDEPTNTPAVPMENLQSLIEQELQESAASHEAAPQEPTKTQEKTASKKQTVAVAKSQNYTVRKGDTLSKISQQFYGTPKKWRKIVDANKDRLGHNQMLKAGMTLVIPPKDA